MPATRRLDLRAIERALREVQGRFGELSQCFTEPRDPFTDEVLHNVLEGYALIDDYVARGVDLFDLQQVNLMLEINATVLCGRDPARRLEFAPHLAATEAHFFNNVEGGIKDLFNWYSAYRSESVWKRAAGVYVRILSKPQLFIEGNHRSGSLIVSYLLIRAGLPPFVLTLDNAKGYFNPSSVIRNSAKHGVKALFELPKIKKKYAAFLEDQAADSQRFFLGEKHASACQGGA
ncbi:hypothetical protein N5J43_24875 [Pseudomonas nicosulfuronedens]|uniref:Fido domain-containing protein n=1 Tax=Pseudomonas nicosulfuronedens TaxID=2571105 RepID=A0A5R9QL83_9PSED|nr:hypothetical protein [Pseudomonas nicosulfuronedens]MDH1012937.1 hypothetical protein [Pseudomonas nicosulfuronedens]MDH1982201.1 hypothetical protein [Pseudomonas nicosulfuronedens]MDH2030686.1 hypothetical protein [Pseudomonas nicosulfuronedens]TLX69854.1 hypothetical protein FAS41_29815 [Pseudomonas nicosulfuronedens]